MITKEEFKKAIKIVNQYYREQPIKTDKQTNNYPCKEAEKELCPICYGEGHDITGNTLCIKCNGNGKILIKNDNTS